MSSFQLSFATNCSIPPTPYHFVFSPNSRGTLDILWTSLSTLILCTWTIQHLSVPPKRETPTWRDKAFKTLDTLARRVLWMLTNLVAPEVLVGKALVDWISARHSKKRMVDFATEDGVEWTVTHGFYANMGGFIVRFGSCSEPKLERRTSKDEFAEKEKVSDAMKSGNLGGGTDQSSPQPLKPSSMIYPTAPPSNEVPEAQDWPVDARDPGDEADLTTSQPGKPPSKSSSIITSATEVPNVQDSKSPAESISKNSSEDIQTKAPSKSDCPLRGRTGYNCPCRSAKSDVEYEYMSFSEITAHPSAFWNGRFRVFPLLLSLGHKYSTDLEKSPEEKKNQDIAGQCLYELAIKRKTTQTDFYIVAEQLSFLQGREWTLDAEQMRIARERGIIDSLPSFSVEELDDQSKGDILVKSLAVVTVFYLVLEFIFRHVADLPSSQLEVAVIAFSATASIIYFLFFFKPQDVGVPRYIDTSRYPSPEDMRLITLAAPVRSSVGGGGKRLFIEIRNMALHNCGSSVALDDSGQALSLKIFFVGAALGGSLFAAIHCVAWNFSFPTPVERLLWRIACLTTIVLPVIALLQNLSVEFVKIFMRRYFPRKDMPDTGWRFQGFIGDNAFISQVLLQVLGVVYVLSRIYLIVEVFRALFFLPPETFVATSWSIEFPHFG